MLLFVLCSFARRVLDGWEIKDFIIGGGSLKLVPWLSGKLKNKCGRKPWVATKKILRDIYTYLWLQANKNNLAMLSALFLSALTTPNNKIFDFVFPPQAGISMSCHHVAQFISTTTQSRRSLGAPKVQKKCPKSDLIRFDRIVIELHAAVCLVFVCPTRSGWLRNQRFYYWGWFTKTGSLA